LRYLATSACITGQRTDFVLSIRAKPSNECV